MLLYVLYSPVECQLNTNRPAELRSGQNMLFTVSPLSIYICCEAKSCIELVIWCQLKMLLLYCRFMLSSSRTLRPRSRAVLFSLLNSSSHGKESRTGARKIKRRPVYCKISNTISYSSFTQGFSGRGGGGGEEKKRKSGGEGSKVEKEVAFPFIPHLSSYPSLISSSTTMLIKIQLLHRISIKKCDNKMNCSSNCLVIKCSGIYGINCALVSANVTFLAQ